MTRNCATADFQAFTVSSFFSRSDTLLPGLPVHWRPVLDASTSCCLSLVDLVLVGKKLKNAHERNILINLLSKQEKGLFATYSYPKRQQEWLGGRLACKQALFRLPGPMISSWPDQSASLSILPAPNGRPVLTCASASANLPCISISHSGRYAVGMAAIGASCGLDIQIITSKIIKVQSHFAQPEEIDLLNIHAPDLNLDEHLTLLWAAKEAIKKALLHDQPAMFRGVVLQSLNLNHFYSLKLRYPGGGQQPAEITAVRLDNTILAFTPGIPSTKS